MIFCSVVKKDHHLSHCVNFYKKCCILWESCTISLFDISYLFVYGKIRPDLVRYSRRTAAPHMTYGISHCTRCKCSSQDRNNKKQGRYYTTNSIINTSSHSVTKIRSLYAWSTPMSLCSKRGMKMVSCRGKYTGSQRFCTKNAPRNTIPSSRVNKIYSTFKWWTI